LPQERGRRRRRQLQQSALAMLAETRFQDLTFQSIADRAGVPLASCYHFYGSKLDLVRALADQLTDAYLDRVFDDEVYEGAADWQECIRRYISVSVEHHARSKAELQIFFSGDVPLALREDALNREKVIGARLLEILAHRYDMPDVPNADDVFFRAVEIARTVLALDYQQHGELTAASVAEAVRAVSGYLLNYLPPVLPAAEGA